MTKPRIWYIVEFPKGYVSQNSSSWLAQIIVNKKKIHLGTFRDQLSAANAYWEASKKHFGEFARMSTSTT